MKKLTKKIPLGKRTRYITTLIGEEVANPDDRRPKQWLMLQTIANTPDLMNCGPTTFESMKMVFNGEQWVVEMQADVIEA